MHRLSGRALPLLLCLALGCAKAQSPAPQFPPLTVIVGNGALNISWNLGSADVWGLSTGTMALYRQVSLKQCDPQKQTLAPCGQPALVQTITPALTGGVRDNSLSVPWGERSILYTLSFTDGSGHVTTLAENSPPFSGQDDIDGDGVTDGDCDDGNANLGACDANASCGRLNETWLCACNAPEVGNGTTCACPTASNTVCSNACVDTTSDPGNCGSCGKQCDTGSVCVQSHCTTCSGGTSNCAGQCVDETTDPNNCGGCGTVCAADMICSGSCVGCASGMTSCANRCVDTTTDLTNCGACGAVCGADQICAGQCTDCPATQQACGSQCLDTDSDPANCGTCGHTCSQPASVCSGGECGCPTGYSGANCDPINTCLTNNGGCQANAMCMSTGPGTNTCSCDSGYDLDGGACVCPFGYSGTACQTAVDSCTASHGGCPIGSTCVSTGPGVNTCDCGSGYNYDGGVCAPVDVCTNGTASCANDAGCQYTGPATYTCQCNAASTNCSGVCADLETDVNNCGVCGVQCAQSATCAMGECSCPTGDIVCGGACTVESVDNCGCGISCGAGSTCVMGICQCPKGQIVCAGGCTAPINDSCGLCGCPSNCTAESPCVSTIVDGLGESGLIVADSEYVYFANLGGQVGTGEVLKASIADGVVTLLATGQATPGIVGLSNGSLVWVTDDTVDGQILSVPTSGGSPVTIATTPMASPNAALGSGGLAWLEEPVQYSLPDGGYQHGAQPLRAIGPDGGTPLTLSFDLSDITPAVQIIVVCGEDVLLQTSSYSAVTQTYVGASILSTPIGGGTISTLVTGQSLASPFVTDGTSVYWSTTAFPTPADPAPPAQIISMPCAGGAVATLASVPTVFAMTVDDLNVYLAAWTSVLAIPKTGGVPVTIAGAQAGASQLTTNATSVLWFNEDAVVQQEPGYVESVSSSLMIGTPK